MFHISAFEMTEMMNNFTFHPEVNMNVCTQFHVDPSNSCVDILL